MTLPVDFEVVDCWGDEKAPSAGAGTAAAVKARPAHSRRLRRLIFGGSKVCGFLYLDFMRLAFCLLELFVCPGKFARNSYFPLTCLAIASPRSRVLDFPPTSGVRTLEFANVVEMAASMASAPSSAPRCRSIMAPDQICPMGLAIPFPAMSGADPWTGSNMEGNSFSGLRFADGAMPIDTTTAGPRSERMSPNRFEPTTTSNQSGCRTK